MYYYTKTVSGTRARFCYPQFCIIDKDGMFVIKDLFAIDIDLESRRMVKAELDDEELTAPQAAILLFFNGISAHHVKIHSFANWGVNVEPEQEINDPFHSRNSIITVMYNYMGYTAFVCFFPFWKMLGLLDSHFGEPALVSSILYLKYITSITHNESFTA